MSARTGKAVVIPKQGSTVMGLVHAEIIVQNLIAPGQPQLAVTALVDTAAAHLCIPEALAKQLQIEPDDVRNIELADGTRKPVPYATGIRIAYRELRGTCSALILGNEVLLGAEPLQSLNLVIIPKTHQLEINPRAIRV